MRKVHICIDINSYPSALHPFLLHAKLFDSSCSPEASVIFIDKDDGYFLKIAPQGTLAREAAMTKYFHSKGLSANVITYLSQEQDLLLTEKVCGNDCIAAEYLAQPERLCDILAERLALLHSVDFSNCPVPNHTTLYLDKVTQNKRTGSFDKSCFPDSFGYASAEEAWAVIEAGKHLLLTNTLLHGDYCLPNIILNNWQLSGFIDLDNAGVGDRHVDLFWGIWTLQFNLKTNRYRERFIDAYGRSRVNEEMLRIVAAAEVFG